MTLIVIVVGLVVSLALVMCWGLCRAAAIDSLTPDDEETL